MNVPHGVRSNGGVGAQSLRRGTWACIGIGVPVTLRVIEVWLIAADQGGCERTAGTLPLGTGEHR